jgi:hypothetical protein
MLIFVFLMFYNFHNFYFYFFVLLLLLVFFSFFYLKNLIQFKCLLKGIKFKEHKQFPGFMARFRFILLLFLTLFVARHERMTKLKT